VTGAAAEVAEVTGAAAEVTDDAAEEPEPEPVPGEVTGAEVTEVAACACRENTSKTTRIPAATIATCIARRAMYRKIGCGISSSPPPDRPDPAPNAPHQ
jgi:hypothetical protein